MREMVWLRLRRLPLLRKLYAIPPLAGPLRWLSFQLMPAGETRPLRVRSGPGKGLMFNLNPRWETEFWEGSYEKTGQEFFQTHRKSGSVFYDVGANFGFYSLLAARCGARVFAFEPDVQNAQSLECHARLNSLETRIDIIRAAVYSSSGSINLEPASFERNHGNAHVVNHPSRSGVVVPCTTLDDFAREHAAPNVVKIDVEGAESEVLKGGERIFAESRPHLLCEVHDLANASFVETWLSTCGYEIRWLNENHELPRQLVATPR